MTMWRTPLAAVFSRSLMLSTCVALSLSGCQGVIDPAPGNGQPGAPDAGDRPDAVPGSDAGPTPDAREGIDAAPVDPSVISLTQSNNPTAIDPGASLACTDNMTGFTAINNYFRVFSLPDLGIAGDFEVTSVQFAVRSAISLQGVQPVGVNLYTLEGALAFANLGDPPIAQEVVQLPDQALTLIDVPFAGAVVPAGSTLAVEIFVPDGVAGGHELLVGFNTGGQSGPAFIAAPTCNFAEPVEISAANMLFDIHLIMTVSGRPL